MKLVLSFLWFCFSFYFSQNFTTFFCLVAVVFCLCTKVSRFLYVYPQFSGILCRFRYSFFCSFIHILVFYVLFSKYSIIELFVYVCFLFVFATFFVLNCNKIINWIHYFSLGCLRHSFRRWWWWYINNKNKLHIQKI